MSTQTMEIYKCDLCGLQVEVINAGACPPSCCGQTMRLMKENTTDGAKEKHVPVVSVQGNGILVKVGEMPHPMEPDHYIEWIEVINGSYVNRYQLRPGGSAAGGLLRADAAWTGDPRLLQQARTLEKVSKNFGFCAGIGCQQRIPALYFTTVAAVGDIPFP